MKRLILVLTLVSTPAWAWGLNDEAAADMKDFGRRMESSVPKYEPVIPETQHYYQRKDRDGDYNYEYLKRMD